MQQVDFLDCLKFIMDNRGKSTFVDWTFEEILNELQRHTNKRTCIMTGFPNNKFSGLILFDVNDENKTLHICHIICLCKESFKAFIETYKERYPTYAIQAYRHGNFVRYSNTAKLISRLTTRLFYV